ncbi:hypothetical protein RhiXN_09590 [Rhizoctonia solani]|uniref:Uncharacterized protein n=1 Tax=Rhizoctonia solani TaxID=456999 RepID=A0A8H8SZ40_9AGAM|nr:uncharacterized protein RhiXN_09590 [Rhizoctonia solani]QRW22003.1 hypothetical protein RhiXN_09590 [Rhizoctonia solani]
MNSRVYRKCNVASTSTLNLGRPRSPRPTTYRARIIASDQAIGRLDCSTGSTRLSNEWWDSRGARPHDEMHAKYYGVQGRPSSKGRHPGRQSELAQKPTQIFARGIIVTHSSAQQHTQPHGRDGHPRPKGKSSDEAAVQQGLPP